jgi:hypothetical protein
VTNYKRPFKNETDLYNSRSVAWTSKYP